MAQAVVQDESILAGLVRTAAEGMLFSNAQNSLASVPIDELSKSKAGIRVSTLKDAGLETFLDLATASDFELTRIDGIGEKQLESIRNITNEFQNQLAKFSSIKLSPDNRGRENIALIHALANYRSGKGIRDKMMEYAAYIQKIADDIIELNPVTNGIQWFFSNKTRKNESLQAEYRLRAFFGFDAPEITHIGANWKIKKYIEAYDSREKFDEEYALSDFAANSADYYATLEELTGTGLSKTLIYSSIPSKLASEIDDQKLDLTGFHGTLRSYQKFGAKYIIHQGFTLLGDDMGLGKTVQAIAAMVHLYNQYMCMPNLSNENSNANDIQTLGKTPLALSPYFLVVCPASVLINWVREVKKFSDIPAYLVHGKDAEENFINWQNTGGVCVTNYETMGKIVGGIDNKMRLALMVIDEAHYIKNPDAKRTKYIYALENESDKILLMTGTPLENKVSEMCTLIDFVRPDMGDDVRAAANLSSVPEFREMLAPVYLRRLREDVLSELPEIEHKSEWCQLTDADRDNYIRAVIGGNFNDLRRVSFLQDDLMASSKIQRIKELVEEAKGENRKVIIYSFFRETIDKVCVALGDDVSGVITGSTPTEERQSIIDRFSFNKTILDADSKANLEANSLLSTESESVSVSKANLEADSKAVLVAQIQAGGTGLNIQAASIVIFCEPQIKPSLENQALSRVYRMGQVRNVLVYHLLCPETIDEAMLDLLYKKQSEFNIFAHESSMGAASDNVIDKEWIKDYILKEQRRYLEQS